jgi:hypothetical protein
MPQRARFFLDFLFIGVSTGGAELGARPPAAGSLHRAGCEDGRAGQRQDPSIYTGHFSSFQAISQNIHS